MSPQGNPLYEAILAGNAPAAAEAARSALSAGADPQDLLSREMIPAMDEVGRRFEANEYFVPELLIAARAMKGALALVSPLLAEKGSKPLGRVVIGSVKGDLHDIGKNLVASMLEGAGFEVADLGVDVPPGRFLEAARERQASMVCLSALLTTTMTSMRTTIRAFEDAGVRGSVKILVGGAPVTQRFADEIGADGFGESASAAVRIARGLLKAS